MTIIKWRTKAIWHDITRVECTRETDLTVWFIHHFGGGKHTETRSAKVSDYVQYHDTWEAAHAILMDRAQRNVDAARRSLEVANSTLGNVKGMRPPAA